MLGVLVLEKWRQKTFWQKIKLRLARFRPVIMEESCQWGEYFTITVCDKKIPWAGIEDFCRQNGCDMIAPRGVALPPGIPRADTADYQTAVFEAGLLHMLTLWSLPAGKREIYLADPAADWADLLKKLLPHCAVPQVITENSEGYMAIREELFAEYGAAILQYARMPAGAGGILLDPACWLAPWQGYKGLVFTTSRAHKRGFVFAAGAPGALAERFSRWPGIEPEDFTAAFFAQGGMDLRKLPIYGIRGDESMPLGDLLKLAQGAY